MKKKIAAKTKKSSKKVVLSVTKLRELSPAEQLAVNGGAKFDTSDRSVNMQG